VWQDPRQAVLAEKQDSGCDEGENSSEERVKNVRLVNDKSEIKRAGISYEGWVGGNLGLDRFRWERGWWHRSVHHRFAVV
jgi:hypothetical protein